MRSTFALAALPASLIAYAMIASGLNPVAAVIGLVGLLASVALALAVAAVLVLYSTAWLSSALRD